MTAEHQIASPRRLLFSVIVPTLNEEDHITRLINSLRQAMDKVEVIVVDGGSRDGTANIAETLGARVFVLQGSKEFEARNYAAARSRAPTLIFSSADVAFSKDSLQSVFRRFEEDSDLVALTGIDIPYDGGPGLRLVYWFYNALRFFSSKLPNPVKVFSTSTNFLVVRKETFEESGGFKTNDVNADGLMGRHLAGHYHVRFDDKVIVYISARRAQSWGFARFARHYLYIMENFLPWISDQKWFRRLKSRSEEAHGEIHSKKQSFV